MLCHQGVTRVHTELVHAICADLACHFLSVRVSDRYEKMENKLLAESTVAGQGATVQYLAACAALQQWEQSALAFLLLSDSPKPLSADQLSAAVESLLEDNFSVSHLGFQLTWCRLQHSAKTPCLSHKMTSSCIARGTTRVPLSLSTPHGSFQHINSTSLQQSIPMGRHTCIF